MNLVDLHIHTTFSDGALTPEQVVKEAKTAGLEAIAITDHDALEGVISALQIAKNEKIELIPGVELSTLVGEKDIHIIGYYLDLENKNLLQALKKFRDAREKRAAEMVKRLENIGIKISFERILEVANGGALGRPHLAEVLVERGYANSSDEAFRHYLYRGSPIYVSKYHLRPDEAFSLILNAGGIPVFAHPGIEGKDNIIPLFIKQGLKGIEVWHSKHSLQTIQHYLALAQQYGLLITGGSDSHGGKNGNPAPLGAVSVPYYVVEEMKKTVDTQICKL
ncbi:MAG: PHP domain-containing protein [Candidatus Edwardsbacteria bacterium]